MAAGIDMGDPNDAEVLNRTCDSLPFTYRFQREILPGRFTVGSGALAKFDESLHAVGVSCVSDHLKGREPDRWGFKTCDGMFSHEYYRALFPRAKFVYLVRDGRDVILSGNGYFQMTNPSSRGLHWDYFWILTFGLSDDASRAPFEIPASPRSEDDVIRHRYWIQAKSWIEHVRMVEALRNERRLAPDTLFVRYEDLCQEPEKEVARLLDFLEMPMVDGVRRYFETELHADSIGKWRRYHRYINGSEESMAEVFALMEPELRLLGYL